MPNPTQPNDPSRYTRNIQGAIDAFHRAGRPNHSLSGLQQVVQQNYDRLNQLGYFRQGPGLSQGHQWRAQGLVKDPTQGGTVDPNASFNVHGPDLYGDPRISYPAPPVSRLGPVTRLVPPLVTPFASHIQHVAGGMTALAPVPAPHPTPPYATPAGTLRNGLHSVGNDIASFGDMLGAGATYALGGDDDSIERHFSLVHQNFLHTYNIRQGGAQKAAQSAQALHDRTLAAGQQAAHALNQHLFPHGTQPGTLADVLHTTIANIPRSAVDGVPQMVQGSVDGANRLNGAAGNLYESANGIRSVMTGGTNGNTRRYARDTIREAKAQTPGFVKDIYHHVPITQTLKNEGNAFVQNPVPGVLMVAGALEGIKGLATHGFSAAGELLDRAGAAAQAGDFAKANRLRNLAGALNEASTRVGQTAYHTTGQAAADFLSSVTRRAGGAALRVLPADLQARLSALQRSRPVQASPARSKKRSPSTVRGQASGSDVMPSEATTHKLAASLIDTPQARAQMGLHPPDAAEPSPNTPSVQPTMQARQAQSQPKFGSRNTLFTATDVQDARARMQRKIKNPPMIIDPVGLVPFQEFGVYAGHLIEGGIRAFGPWRRAMMDRYGEEVRPHLNTLYTAARQAVPKPEFVPEPPAPGSMTIKSQPGNTLVQPGQRGKGIFQTPQELERFTRSKADDLRDFAKNDPENYEGAKTFYRKMGEVAVEIATDPRTKEVDLNKVDLIMRSLAHNSPQASVKGNFTMSMHTGITPEVSGTYRGFGGKNPTNNATGATQKLHAQWENGQPFVAEGDNATPGVGPKVWSFYSNGMTEALNELEARGYKVWNADGTPGPDMPEGVRANTKLFGNRRILDGTVTNDMWHQVFLGEANVGYRFDPKTKAIALKKGKPIRAWSWVDPSSTKTVPTSSLAAQNALREIAKIGSDKGVTSFDEMTPQSKQALRYDPAKKTITLYTKDGERGMGAASPAAHQRLQELTGLITDRINAQGGIHGERLNARTVQALAWGRIKLAHPDPRNHNFDSYDKFYDALKSEYAQRKVGAQQGQNSGSTNPSASKDDTLASQIDARYASDYIDPKKTNGRPIGSVQHILAHGPVPAQEELNAPPDRQHTVHAVEPTHMLANGQAVVRRTLHVTGQPRATSELAAGLSRGGRVLHTRFPHYGEHLDKDTPLAGQMDIPLPKDFSPEERVSLLRKFVEDPLLVYKGKPLFQDAYITNDLSGVPYLVLNGHEMGLTTGHMKILAASNQGIIDQYLREAGVNAKISIKGVISHVHETFPTDFGPARNVR